MRIFAVLVVLLFSAVEAHAVSRDLSSDCTVGSTTPSESQPFDLDACTLQNGDDISGLLLDIANRWGAVYVRAPSKSLNVTADTTQWATAIAGKPIKSFVFLEDQSSANRLTISHAPRDPSAQLALLYPPCSTDPVGAGATTIASKYVMWQFSNFSYVKIGGSNLSMTLVGTHPGLGNASERRCGSYPAYVRDINAGLLDFRVKDGSTPQLVDIRANTRNAEAYSVYFYGSEAVGSAENRVQQVNISGKHWNTSGVFAHAGVRNLWFDPDDTVISDPYVRNMGWDGGVAATVGGRQVGCHDKARASFRQTSAPYYVDQLTGGVTLEYGFISFAPRKLNRVGTSATNPFVVRLKDWGSSGPGTDYPAGVMVKQTVQPILFKGDPHPEYGHTDAFRFIKFVSVPSSYGQGFYEQALTGCAPGNGTSNNYPDARENIIRVEANDGVGVNFGWDVTFAGDWASQWRRGQLFYMAYEPWNTGDRSYGHVLRVAGDTTMSDKTYLHDTDTATGPGTFTNISIEPVQIYQSSSYVAPRANRIEDTNVSGAVSISGSSGTTSIRNVNFKGAARTIVTVGANSSVALSQLCVPSGSRIEGSGTATYNGQQVALPYSLPAASSCALDGTTVPQSPSALVVQ